MKTITVSDEDYKDILLGLDYLNSHGPHSAGERREVEKMIGRVKENTTDVLNERDTCDGTEYAKKGCYRVR